MSKDLAELIDPLIRRNTTIFMFFAALGLISAVGLAIVLVLIPAQPGEEGIKLGMGAFAAFLTIGSAAFGWWGRSQGAGVRELILERPHYIVKMEMVKAQRKGMVMWGLHLTEQGRDKVAITVPSESVGRDLMARLQQLGARVS